MPPSSTTSGPALTVGRTSTSQAVTFTGTNMQDGDGAAWVPIETTTCTSELTLASSQGRSTTVLNGRATFNSNAVVDASLWVLCYRHNYQQQIVSGTFVSEWTLYSGIQLTVVSVDSAAPALAPAVTACADHTVTIIGAGFSRLPVGTSGTFCNFAGVGTVEASVTNDTVIECTTPVPTTSIASQVCTLPSHIE